MRASRLAYTSASCCRRSVRAPMRLLDEPRAVATGAGPAVKPLRPETTRLPGPSGSATRGRLGRPRAGRAGQPRGRCAPSPGWRCPISGVRAPSCAERRLVQPGLNSPERVTEFSRRRIPPAGGKLAGATEDAFEVARVGSRRLTVLSGRLARGDFRVRHHRRAPHEHGYEYGAETEHVTLNSEGGPRNVQDSCTATGPRGVIQARALHPAPPRCRTRAPRAAPATPSWIGLPRCCRASAGHA